MTHRTSELCSAYFFYRPVLWIIGFLWQTIPVQATDISFQGGVIALDANVAEVNHPGFSPFPEDTPAINYHFHGTLRFDQPLTDYLSLTVLAFQDPLLQRRLLSRLSLTYRWVTVEAGPFIGIVNTSDALISPGISTGLRVAAPGVAFGSMRGDTTLVSSIDGYTQSQAEVRLGMYLPFFPALVPSASMDIIYTERRDTGWIIARKQTRYSVVLDTTGPHDDYNIHLTIGYQELGWTVYHETEPGRYQLNSVYAGVSIAYRVLPGLKITFGGVIPIISWITKRNIDTLPTSRNPLFYDFTLGFIWSGNLWRPRR